MGQLVFQATLGGQVNLVGPNTASTFNLNVPAVAGNLITSGDSATVTNTMLAGSIANAKLLNSSVTVGSTSIALGATSTTLAGLTGVTTSALTDSGLTSGRVTYASTGGLLADSANLTFNGTTLTTANDASISGLTVGKGGGSGSANTAVGASVLTALTLNSGVTAVGNLAGNVYNTNSDTGASTFIGYTAGRYVTTGIDNTFIGAAGAATTTGSANTAVGSTALKSNTTGNSNTAVGYQAGYTTSLGLYNTFIGTQAGYTSAVNGNSGNTCVGFQVGYSLTTGIKNTFIGGNANFSSGGSITTGSSNTIIGAYNGNQGGLDIRTASNYIVLSDGDGNPRGIFDSSGHFLVGQTVTGNATVGSEMQSDGKIRSTLTGSTNATDTLDVYSTGASNYRFYVDMGGTVHATSTSISAISDQTLKTNIKNLETGLTEVMALKPRRFDWLNGDGTNVAGFVSQEVQEVLPDLVQLYKYSEDENGNRINKLGLKMGDMLPTMVKAIQELKTIVDAQATEIAELKAKVGI